MNVLLATEVGLGAPTRNESGMACVPSELVGVTLKLSDSDLQWALLNSREFTFIK